MDTRRMINVLTFGLRRAVTACGVTVLVLTGATLPLAGAAAAPAGHTSSLTEGATSPLVRPGDNPANPSCRTGLGRQFSGGTGAFYSNSFLSTYVSAPFFGAQDVPNGNFTNIFLYPHSGTMTWDQYQASLPAAKQGPTQEQLDGITKALVCSSYFDELTQYNINPPSYSGDQTTFANCVAAAVHDANVSYNGIISYATMRTFAACNSDDSGDPSTQVNIFVSPDIKVSDYGGDRVDMCTTATAAYHGWGLSVPNFTVVPVVQCNKTPGDVMHSLSHEMVEALSDPAGMGWIHGPDPFDFWNNYDKGELGDICSSVGLFPTGPVSFPTTSNLAKLGLSNLAVAPYWSDQDDACEPTSIMNDVLRPLSGSPSKRLVGGGPDSLTIPISQPSPPPGVLDSLELDITTGKDNLNSSSSFDAVVTSVIGGTAINTTTTAVNEGAEFGSNSLHAVLLKFPAGIPVGDIKKVTIKTNLPGGLFGDNWDITGVEVQADVNPNTTGSDGCAITPLPLLNLKGDSRLQDDSLGLVRMMGGGVQTFTRSFPAPPGADANLLVTDLLLTVQTGKDDLRGGNSPGDNADAILHLSGGRTVSFPDINTGDNWPSYSTSPQVDLLNFNSLPPNTLASSLVSISLRTDLPGGLGGDNWDVAGLSLFAVLGCQGIPPSAPQPVVKPINLVNVVGHTTLDDGTTGLCREKGSPGTHDCMVSIPAPAGFDPNDPLDSLSITIHTGGDDLRGGTFAGDNANVLVSGMPTFTDVNHENTWDNNTVNTVPLAPIPAGYKLANLTSVDVATGFGGGCCGDNWDITEISVKGTVTVPPSMSPPGRVRTEVPARRRFRARPQPSGLVRTEWSGESSTFPPPAVVRRATGSSPWTPTLPQNKGSADNVLLGTTCTAARSCVAVGYTDENADTPQALIERWNGSSWSVQSLGAAGSQDSVLNGVSCLTSSSCVAVGYQGSGEDESGLGLVQALIETWNGSTWAVTNTNVSSKDTVSVLRGVSCVGTAFCAAVGYQELHGGAVPLTEVLGGTGWSVTPSVRAKWNSVLNGVSCVSSTYCIGVGTSDGSGGSSPARTLAEVFDGTTWSIEPSANAGVEGNVFSGMGDNILYSVSCPNVFHCVAVGTHTDFFRRQRSLVETLGARGFALTGSPNPGAQDVLYGVSCSAITLCRAVGVRYLGTTSQTLNENLSGSTWFTTASPNPAGRTNFLTGDWCSMSSCLAVGAQGEAAGASRTLALRFAPTVPGAPTGVQAANTGNLAANVSFKPPADNGGSPVSSYTVTATDSTNSANGGQTESGMSSPITVSNLHQGDSYTFTVEAANATGPGPASMPSNAIVAAG